MTPIIPENLAFCSHLLQLYLQPLLNWFSDLVYNRLVVQGAEDHPLVRLQRLFDFMALEQACQPYQHVVGPGRRVIHSVPKLLRAMLVKYLLNLSLRRLEQEIRYNLVIKWFVGYSLLEEGPDHTTLHRFEAYLYREQPRLFFDTLLAQIDATVADGHEVVQMGDTFALRANAALESLLQRLRHLTHNLLHTLQAETPAMYAALAPTLDEAALFGWKKEKREYHLSTEEWQQRLFTTVQAVTACLAQLEGGCHPPAVRACIAWLQKTLADELHLVWDESGQLQDVILLPAKKRGLHRICSGSDPEATIRNHGENKKDFGYNVSVATTLDFIREIRADTGSTADVTPIPVLLTAQQTHHDTLPAKLVYDQIAGTGKTAHQVDAATNGRTQLVAKPMPPSKTDTFGPEAFTLSDDALSLECPNGQRTLHRYRSGSGDGWLFRFTAAQCRSCPFLRRCRNSAKIPTSKRDVFISYYRPQYDDLVAYSKTETFKQEMRLRTQVERIIAGLVLHNGARRARFRGLVKVDFQAKMCGMAYNVKRWLVLLAEKEGQYTRPVRRAWGLPTPSQG